MDGFLSQIRRNRVWRNVIAGYCLTPFVLAGVALCLCTHEGACCGEDAAQSATHSETCTDVVHDHITVERQDGVVGKTLRVMPLALTGDFFSFCRNSDFDFDNENRRRRRTIDNECVDDHAVALVRLTRRLC